MPANKSDIHAWIDATVRPYARRALGPAALASLAGMSALGVPWLARHAVDAAAAGSPWLTWLALGGGLVLAGLALRTLSRLWSIGINQALQHRLRTQLFRRLLDQRLDFHKSRAPGHLLSALYQDAPLISGAACNLPASAAMSALIVIGAAWALAAHDPRLMAAMLSAAIVVALLARRFVRRNRDMVIALNEHHAHLHALIEESLSQVLVVKSLQLEPWAESRMAESQARVVAMHQRLERHNAVLAALAQLVMVAALGGGWLYLVAGSASLGGQLAALLYGLLMARQTGTLVGLAGQFRQARGARDRLASLLSQPGENGATPERALRPLGRIEARDLSFAYAGNRVLDGLNFSLESGSTTVITGPNGAGKTTLLNLLAGLESPPAGSLFRDGKDVTQIPVAALRKNVAYLPQDSLLSQATILENVRMGRLDASDEAVQAALEMAGAGPLLARLPKGLDTELGAAGSRLSGGERRRIALARVLLQSDAELVLLDEPTSGLDRESERDIMKAALAALEGRTLVMVSHRPHVIELADQVIALGAPRDRPLQRVAS